MSTMCGEAINRASSLHSRECAGIPNVSKHIWSPFWLLCECDLSRSHFLRNPKITLIAGSNGIVELLCAQRSYTQWWRKKTERSRWMTVAVVFPCIFWIALNLSGQKRKEERREREKAQEIFRPKLITASLMSAIHSYDARSYQRSRNRPSKHCLVLIWIVPGIIVQRKICEKKTTVRVESVESEEERPLKIVYFRRRIPDRKSFQKKITFFADEEKIHIICHKMILSIACLGNSA